MPTTVRFDHSGDITVPNVVAEDTRTGRVDSKSPLVSVENLVANPDRLGGSWATATLEVPTKAELPLELVRHAYQRLGRAGGIGTVVRTVSDD